MHIYEADFHEPFFYLFYFYYLLVFIYLLLRSAANNKKGGQRVSFSTHEKKSCVHPSIHPPPSPPHPPPWIKASKVGATLEKYFTPWATRGPPGGFTSMEDARALGGWEHRALKETPLCPPQPPNWKWWTTLMTKTWTRCAPCVETRFQGITTDSWLAKAARLVT